jgi:hypothetical protein
VATESAGLRRGAVADPAAPAAQSTSTRSRETLSPSAVAPVPAAGAFAGTRGSQLCADTPTVAARARARTIATGALPWPGTMGVSRMAQAGSVMVATHLLPPTIAPPKPIHTAQFGDAGSKVTGCG